MTQTRLIGERTGDFVFYALKDFESESLLEEKT